MPSSDPIKEKTSSVERILQIVLIVVVVFFIFGVVYYFVFPKVQPQNYSFIQPKKIIYSSEPPTPITAPKTAPIPIITLRPELLPGPARRYVPASNEQMPSGYEGTYGDDVTNDNGNYYSIKFDTTLDGPSIIFWAYVARTIDKAQQGYNDESQQYQVDSSNTRYTWLKSTYSSSIFSESGQYKGVDSAYGIWGEVGRVIRVENVVISMKVKIRNLQGVTDPDINKINIVLDNFTTVVENKFR